MAPIGKNWSCNWNFFIRCPESELTLYGWLDYTKYKRLERTHCGNHISIWKHRFDFKRDSYLQTKTFSGDFIDSRTSFLRISVINTQEHYLKCDFGDCYQCWSVNLQVATEIKSNPFLVYLWTQSFYTSPSFPLVRKEKEVTFCITAITKW